MGPKREGNQECDQECEGLVSVQGISDVSTATREWDSCNGTAGQKDEDGNWWMIGLGLGSNRTGKIGNKVAQ